MSGVLARCTILAATLATALPGVAAAQITALGPVDRPTVRFGLAKPFFDGGEFGLATSVAEADLRIPMASNTTFRAGLGLSHATLADVPSSTTLSNPTIGVIFGSENGSFGELGLEIPLAQEWGEDDYATGTALVSDLDRFEHFLSDWLSFHGSYTGRRTLEGGALVGARVGGALMAPVGDSRGDSELRARYATFGQIPVGSAAVGAELSGSADLTEEGDFGSRSVHQITLFAGFPESRRATHVYARLPLDSDLNDALDLVIGVRVGL